MGEIANRQGTYKEQAILVFRAVTVHGSAYHLGCEGTAALVGGDENPSFRGPEVQMGGPPPAMEPELVLGPPSVQIPPAQGRVDGTLGAHPSECARDEYAGDDPQERG